RPGSGLQPRAAKHVHGVENRRPICLAAGRPVVTPWRILHRTVGGTAKWFFFQYSSRPMLRRPGQDHFMQTESVAPLAGVRVLDASRVLAGPFCGQVLGDLGAEVIKVERPGQGDETREWGPPFFGDLSAYYLSCNRNKKAITLDLAKTEGLHLFQQLVQRSDVLLENFKAASAQRLGLTP